jgi:hypothetical protein
MSLFWSMIGTFRPTFFGCDRKESDKSTISRIAQ